MYSLKPINSRVLHRRMFIAYICWRKFHNVLFFILVALFCISIYTQKANMDLNQDYSSGMHYGELISDNTGQQKDWEWRSSLADLSQRILLENTNQDEEVDMVYTWVNGSDPKFIKEFERLMNVTKKRKPDVLALNRYNDWGTLKYSLRSVERFASWIRHIYLVTNGQVPDWLELDNPKLSVITHEEIFSNKSDLPAFTSPAIECHIHKIQGLSRRFIYMNDDIILTSLLRFEDFYTEKDGYKLRFFHERLEHCNKLCPANSVNNGVCEINCTTESCEYDGDDCGTDRPEYPGPDKTFMFDSWAGSMMHTHFMFNKAFGPQDRYIPEHSAHLFDKNILAQLIEEFPEEWNRTSATKVRHHLTIQPEFAYYNYLQMLEQLGRPGVKTTAIWAKKDAEKIDFVLDNRNAVERKIQFQWCKTELVLKRPKFLVFSDHFNKAILSTEKEKIQTSLSRFLNRLLPKPSQFEKSQLRDVT